MKGAAGGRGPTPYRRRSRGPQAASLSLRKEGARASATIVAGDVAKRRERDRAKGEQSAPPAASAGGIAAVRVYCRCQLRAELPWLSPPKPSPSLPLELATGREKVTVVGVAVTILTLLVEGYWKMLLQLQEDALTIPNPVWF
ncbi:uncharacterized protein DS421_9g268750 [Arachis hypogaea]|nr:uncharacterized protein DS421_9g268750 [Arachis hypogaea]